MACKKSGFKQRREGIPPDIAELKRFFPLWKNGKDGTPKGWNNPQSWQYLDDIPEEKPFGFSLTESTILFVDFDHIRMADGSILPAALDAYNRMTAKGRINTYTEKSVSGNGFHLLCDLGDFADSFEPLTNTENLIIPLIEGGIEAYRALPEEERKKAPKIEFFYRTGGRYCFLTGDNKKAVPMVKGEEAAGIMRECLKLIQECHQTDTGTETPKEPPKTGQIDDKTRAEILKALNYINADDREIWIRVGQSLQNAGIPLEVWDEWSKKSPKYDDGRDESTAKKWEGFKRSKSKWNAGTIFILAKENGYKSNEKALPATAENGVLKPLKVSKYIAPLTAPELLKMEIPPIKWVVRGLLGEGLAVLSAPPKYYKSFLCLQLCLCVCQGLPFLNLETVKGGCLYLDLESGHRRPRDRLKMMLGGREAPPNLFIATLEEEPGTLGTDFLDKLNRHLDDNKEISLVVVDVFQKIRKGQGKNQNAYNYDYENLKPLQEVSSRRGICILVVHHNKKEFDQNDIYNSMSGSTGLLGAVDTALMIVRDKRGCKESSLNVTGRDVEDQKLSIQFNKNTMLWEYVGLFDEIQDEKESEEYRRSPVVRTIKKCLELNNGRWSGTVQDLIKESEYHGSPIYTSPESVGKKLRNLAEALGQRDCINFTRSRCVRDGQKTTMYSFYIERPFD